MMDPEARAYWAQQRRNMLRRNRRRGGGFGSLGPITTALIALMVLGWLVESFFPAALERLALLPPALGEPLSLLVATVLPGSLIGLIFAGLFVAMIGSLVEQVTAPWQYLVIFFGAGVIGALVGRVAGGYAIAGSLAGFGLAGAYVRAMGQFDAGGAARWALGLLIINVILSGFQPAVLTAMFSAFAAGYVLALALDAG